MNHVGLLYKQKNVFADGKLISKEEKHQNLHFVFLGYIYGKCHKPSVPPCLRYVNHERGTGNQMMIFLNLNFGHISKSCNFYNFIFMEHLLIITFVLFATALCFIIILKNMRHLSQLYIRVYDFPEHIKFT